MSNKVIAGFICVGLLAFSGAIRAELTSVGPGGFAVKHVFTSQQQPAAVYQALLNISQWWHPDHSWSGDAANLYIREELGGCFCERLPAASGNDDAPASPAGSVEHLRIFHLNPNREIRLDGSLGPLSEMPVQGRMIWKIEAGESGSTVTFSYLVHGFLEGGFEGIAGAVDGVIGQQASRLEQLLKNPDL